METNKDLGQLVDVFHGGQQTIEEIIEDKNISNIIKRFGQWVVTDFGLECLFNYYPIPKDRINEDWLAHVSDKNWVILEEFKAAYLYAKDYFTNGKS